MNDLFDPPPADPADTLPLADYAQRAYLDRQGYATFGSLLGHIIAWWEDGALKIAAMRGDPALADRLQAELAEQGKLGRLD